MARWVKSADEITFVDLDRVDRIVLDTPEWTIFAITPNNAKVALTSALTIDQARAVAVQLLGVADIQP